MKYVVKNYTYDGRCYMIMVRENSALSVNARLIIRRQIKPSEILMLDELIRSQKPVTCVFDDLSTCGVRSE